MMRISVCMATFNGEHYIGQQLGSILPQLADQDELVISDDSSTDGTIRIIEGCGDAHIRLFSGNTFHNPIYNIENAIRQSGGEVIVLSDQDDVWLENKLDLVRRWFSSKRAGINTLVLDGAAVDEQGHVIEDSLFASLGSGRGILKNLYRNTYMGCCMAFTRQLLRIALPFPPNIPMHDSWLGILSELYGSVEFMPEKTINYRRHPLNRSFQRFAVRQQIRWRFFLAYHLLKRTFSRPSGLFGKKSTVLPDEPRLP
jgi:glycosyltransferase involved in cell wall biosynthesis